MEACNEIDAVLDVLICKNLFLCNRQKTNFYLLMMPGDKPFKTKELSSQIHSARLSFASAEDMEKYLDIHPGAVSVMGLMNDHENKVQLLMDEDIRNGEYIGCHPCRNTTSMRFTVKDLLEKVLPEIHHEPEFIKLVETAIKHKETELLRSLEVIQDLRVI
jgi:Ala-tRNA(Pro) deacylase